MTQLAGKRSAAFFLVAWFLMAALFADGVNLDDLLPGTFVIHDSDDAVQSALVISSSRDGQQTRHFPWRTQQATKASKPLSDRSLRIVFDEDSPSEAAGPIGSGIVAIAPVVDPQPLCATESPTPGLLHLLHCTLLI